VSKSGPPRPPARTAARMLVLAAVAGLAACSDDPGASLLTLPEQPRQAVAVPPTTPDGFPNISYSPVEIDRQPLPPQAIAASEEQLAADLRSHAALPPPPVPPSAAALAAAGATHVEDARAAIDAAAAQ
jgi:hypothetical protein